MPQGDSLISSIKWPWETSLPVSLNVFYDKKHEYICFRGGDLKGFGDNNLKTERGGTSRSVLLKAFHHKEHEYIWFSGWDLNGFRDV